ncbi:HupE/UreJ family protein [Flavobacterium luteum]|uniref:HupE/UreJ family protein n=1 Tax=Flavobacterium luteum TaxID=2026654 RepID=A0A7J5AF02_9FLAO|nr:HupE/UreJ family protein [Flavobacterium luteum]KAB1156152.1 HupE/UreJ family protein [Flavobacterium luteum]
MSDFWIYFQLAWRHVLDIKSYNFILFLAALAIPYSFREWKKLLLLLAFFAIGELVALLLSLFGIVIIKLNLKESLIPITILITALFNLFIMGKSQKGNGINWIGFFVLFFGIIHGLGFSRHFKSVTTGNLSDKIVPLFEYTLGVQAAQILVIVLVLILSYIVQNFFRFSKRDFILASSSFIIGVVLPQIIKSII